MKALVASDFHLHNFKTFGHNSEQGISKRLYEQKQVLQQILDICKERKVELFVFPGDLFHQAGEIPTEALNIADWFFYELSGLGIQWVVVNGNHDLTKRIDASDMHSAVSPFDAPMNPTNLKIFKYGYDSSVDEKTIKGYDLVIVHKDLKGEQYGGYTVEDGADWKVLAKNNRWVVCGHIHTPKKLAENCFIVGAPMHLNFGDVGDRGVWLIDLAGTDGEFIPLQFPQFLTVHTKEEIVKDDGNYYRLLGAKERVEGDNVITVIEPEFFEERLKESSFAGILGEWVKLNGRDGTTIDAIKDIIGGVEAKLQKVFKGRLLNVSVKDFFSFKEATFEVKNGFTLVSGKSDEFSSNGSGKSTLVSESLLWCFFGETSKGLKGDDVIRTGAKDCRVTIVLGLDPVYYITRSRSGGLSVVMESQGEQHELTTGMLQKQAQEYLENEVLGFDSVTFKTACLFSQEQLMMLTGLSDTEKTNMITSLLGFEQYDTLYEKVVAKIKSSQEAIDTIQKSIQRIEYDIDFQKRTLVDKNKQKQSTEEKKSTAGVQILELEQAIKEYLIVSIPTGPANNRDFSQELKDLEDKQFQSLQAIQTIDQESSELSEKRQTISNKVTELRTTITSLNQVEADLLLEEQHLLVLEIGQRCGHCGSLMTEEAREIRAKEIKQTLKENDLKIGEVLRDLGAVQSKYTVVDEELQGLKVSKQEHQDMIAKINQDVKSVRLDQQKYDLDVRLYEKKQAEQLRFVETKRALIDELRKRIDDFNTDIQSLVKAIEDAQHSIQRLGLDIEGLKKNIMEWEQLISTYQFWQTSFSSKGIKSLLLDRFCNQFNVLVNSYLSRASSGRMSLTMTPTKALKSGEERNKIGMDIFNNGTVRKYESLSGGEKRRVDFALCLAMNQFISEQHGLKNGLLGIIVFDELFSFLDASAFENIGDLLIEESRTKALYVIVHGSGLESYAHWALNISKENGISAVV